MSERAIADPSQHGWTEVDGKWMWAGSGGGSGNGSIQDGNTEGQITTWGGTEWTPEGAVVVSNGDVGIGTDTPLYPSTGRTALTVNGDTSANLVFGHSEAPAHYLLSDASGLTIGDDSGGNVVIDADGNVVLSGQLSGRVMFRKDVGGVYFADSNVLPAGTDGWAADNVMSLGSEFNRFKDAHFSGDVHIAGRLFINGEEVTAGGGGASYTAGNGITIDGDTIKMSGSYSGNLTATDFIAS